MSPAERTRLIGVLGRLGSDFDGERAAAGLLATRLLKSTGLTWEEVLVPRLASNQGHAQPQPDRGDDLGLCLRHLDELTGWESNFVLSLSTVRGRSPKQVAVLQRIAETLRARGRA